MILHLLDELQIAISLWLLHTTFEKSKTKAIRKQVKEKKKENIPLEKVQNKCQKS